MLLTPFRLIYRVASRFRAERSTQTAAALAFTTVLGLVPMIAGAVALISILPFGSGMGKAVQEFLMANLLPDKAGAVITKYFAQFATKAVKLTWIGVIALSFTALLQMLTIERTFNIIWKIRKPRPLGRRLLLHAIALLIGPVVFGASLAIITYLVTASLGLINEAGWFRTFLYRGVPFIFMTGIFTLLYWGVPNRDVAKSHALIGGLFSALAFTGMHKLFGLYLSHFTGYTVLYGPFAVVPIFLTWLFLSWTVILLGAYIVAELPSAIPAPPPAKWERKKLHG